MERFALLFIALIFTITPTFALAQHAWQDDGLVWVELMLVDMDAPGGPTALRDEFVESCTDASPRSLADWMPHGFRQTGEHRELEEGTCERIIALRLRGRLSWTPASTVIPWQPGKDGSRSIGIPRDGADRLAIMLPTVLLVGAQAYQVPEPAIISVGDNERSTTVAISLRRLARTVIFEPSDEVTLDRFSLPYNVTTHFLLPGERLVQTDKNHRLHVVAIDPRGRRHNLTEPRDPQRFVSISAYYGWTFEVEVLLRERSHRDWVASLRGATK
ncbi:MAG: hypothetical protein AAB413_05705 [Patescibacteria group bacterium]